LRSVFKIIFVTLLILEILIYLYVQSRSINKIAVFNIIESINSPNTNNLINYIINNIVYRKLIGHFLYNLIVCITLIILLKLYKNNYLLLVLYLGFIICLCFELVQIKPKERVFSIEDIFINYSPYLFICLVTLLVNNKKF